MVLVHPPPQDGPKFDSEPTEVSPGVFERKGSVKKFMVTFKLVQTTTVVDGKVTSVRLQKV